VIGNGDVTSLDEARERLGESGADGVMIGRGTCGRPWFIQQVAQFLKTGIRLPDPPLAHQLVMLLEHYGAILSHYGEETGVRIARKHIGWYSKGLPGSTQFRDRINRLSSGARASDEIRAFYEPLIERVAA
jgi:tRNA-dihydrouridine synthase B